MKKLLFFFLMLQMAVPGVQAQGPPVKDSRLDSLYKIAWKHFSKYEYTAAIENSLELLKQAKHADNDYYHYHAHNILGAGYQDVEDTARAKRQYEYALVFAKKMKNDTLLQWTYNNLGNIYSQNKMTTQKGIEFYEKGIALAEKLEDEQSVFTPTINIAWTYLDNGDYKKARAFLMRAGDIFGDREDSYLGSQLFTLFGRYYMAVDNPEKSKTYFEKAVQMVEKDTLVLQASEAYKHYAKFLFSEQNYKDAFLALEKHNKYKSRIFENEKLRQIETANMQFDINQYRRDLEIAENEQLYKDQLLERSQEKTLILAISTTLLGIFLLLLYGSSISRRKLVASLSHKNKELELAKEEAERLSLLKTKFFSTISHELRTPLYGVIGLTSILREDKSLEKHEEDLKSLKFSADYLLALINDVLQMNKMESNLVKLEKVPFNLKDLIQSIVKSFEFVRLQNKNDILLEIDSKISGNFLGDPVRLSQILMNLVGNAMKFTERGNIQISAKVVEQQENHTRVAFKISDDGPGIPESKQQMIFEEFSQLQAQNYNYQGTGLGLPIVKRLLRLHDSHIELESEEGKGASFRFEIEFENTLISEVPKQPEVIHAINKFNGSEGKKVLVVDDNRINQVVTRRILEQREFKVELSDSGTQAVERIKKEIFDLVLMDVNMPGISGLEATRQIREFNSVLPVIALTAVEIDEIREEILAAGMTDIIVKPYDTSVFFQVIYRNLARPAVVV